MNVRDMAECAEFIHTEKHGKEDKTFTMAGFPFPISNLFIPESIKRALTLRVQPGDIILSSYPKCDSKVVDAIVWKLLYMDLNQPSYCSTTNRSLPCMEMSTVDDLTAAYDYMSRHKLPKLYKTYMPFKLIPFYKKAKYIYVMRTPWEACISYYTFLCLINSLTDTFDKFFNNFLHGKVPFESYFKHVMQWNKKIHESNVLTLCREHVENNPRSAMFTIAAFLGDHYLSQLLNNNDFETNILNDTKWDKPKINGKRFTKLCFAHLYVKCVQNHPDSIKMGYIRPSCTESQLTEIIEMISSKFNNSSIEFLWLSLLKKQIPALFS